MAFEPLAKTVELVLHANSESSERATVLHFVTSAAHAWTTPELNTLCQNFWAACGTGIKQSMVPGVNFREITARDMDVEAGALGSYSIPQPSPGIRGGTDMLPANCALVISWRTGIAGRKYRGRSYWYGASDADAQGSLPSTSFGTAVSTVAGLIGTFVNSGGVAVLLAVASRVLNASTPVNAYVIDAVFDSQRKRLPLRGN